jgi:hypothetical protein
MRYQRDNQSKSKKDRPYDTKEIISTSKKNRPSDTKGIIRSCKSRKDRP